MIALVDTAGLPSPALLPKGVGMKKRTVMLLSVVALMVVMLAMSVAPAFAARYGGRGPDYYASGHAQCAYVQQDYYAQFCH